jgi:hypothetical protein
MLDEAEYYRKLSDTVSNIIEEIIPRNQLGTAETLAAIPAG